MSGTIQKKVENTKAQLQKADTSDLFSVEIRLICENYAGILKRRSFFENLGKGSGFYRAYELIERQVESDIISATQFIETFQGFSGQDKSYLYGLLKNSRKLSSKLGEVVERAIANESIKDDVDVSYVDDLIDAMDELHGRRTAGQQSTLS